MSRMQTKYSAPGRIRRMIVRSSMLIVGLCIVSRGAQGQVSPRWYDYARPHLTWYTIQTNHFNVVFHGDAGESASSRTARVVARIAEDIYGPITDLYGHEPDERVAIILKDYEDYSNGAAYFFDNKIEIWVPALDSPLRGDHNWLRNVITHEFTHIVQVQTSMKAGRRLPFIYLQWLDYEDVRRPDVLYGYPNVIASYPIATISNPAWLAEGTAQYMRADLHYDDWDSHRDMLLRTRLLAGEELSLADMGGFYSHTSLLRESVYNHGFAFTRYLAGRYGEDALARLSRSLGKWRNWNVERAMKDSFGQPANEIYAAWIDTVRTAYRAATSVLVDLAHQGQILEGEGSHNFYPRFSPDGTRLAYVSNRGRDFGSTSLYVRDLETGEISVLDDGGVAAHASTYTCSHGHRIVSDASGSFSWTPDGASIVYSRNVDTREGHTHADLYRVDVQTRKRTRLTEGLRATQPEWSPSGDEIAYVAQRDGTQNVFILNLSSGESRRVTDYDAGVRITDPKWHPEGRWIYYARSGDGKRDLYLTDTDRRTGSRDVPVLVTEADERSPAPDASGSFLYYSSDATGIYNIYRMPLIDGLPAGNPEAVTNVLGGAFMPDVQPDGRRMTYARYEWDGYKIAVVEDPQPVDVPLLAYEPPAVLRKQGADQEGAWAWDRLNAFDDSDVQPIPQNLLADVGGIREAARRDVAVDATFDEGAADLSINKYKGLFTSFSFYPVYRLDRYVKRREDLMEARLPERSRAGSLLRNSKVGLYVSSREMLEGFSLLGGLLVAPTSVDTDGLGDYLQPGNLLRLERDLFLQFDYGKGFGLFPGRWSPQVSIEMYNIRRNVKSGLTIEEFPCTACYPDTTVADLAYNLWEAGAYLRGKVNRALLLEAGYRFSPYRVTTESFFSREANQTIGSSSSRYYIGRALALRAYFDTRSPHRNDDVVPSRTTATLSYEYEPGRLLQRFEVEDGLLVPGYESFHNHRLMLDMRHGMRLPGTINGGAHGLDFRLRGSTVLGGEVDDFFNDYVGGLIGARGYPFYALGGNETLWLQASYTLPLLPYIGRQFIHAYVDKIYARLFADAAAAWSGPFPGLREVRKDAGAELRVALGSYYLFPTALFLSATYGFDAFDVALNEGFVTPDGSTSVRYGQSLQWHFGLLFDFDL